jgi:hypothetical protein
MSDEIENSGSNSNILKEIRNIISSHLTQDLSEPHPSVEKNTSPSSPSVEEIPPFYRVPVNLSGRFLLSSEYEFPCSASEASPGDIVIQAAAPAKLGDKIIAYLDTLGRIVGNVMKVYDSGFVMSIDASIPKRNRIAAQLMFIMNKNLYHLEQRENIRITLVDKHITLYIPDMPAKVVPIIDISPTGIALISDIMPPINSEIMIGKTHARVVRHLNNGFAASFL